MKNTVLETFNIPKPISSSASTERSHLPTKRLTVQVDRKLGDKIQDHAYGTGLTQQEIIHQALVEFISIDPVPTDEIKFQKGLEYVAKKMLSKGYKKEEIQQVTDLSIQQIESLS
jgi:predicted transcriptional regulator